MWQLSTASGVLLDSKAAQESTTETIGDTTVLRARDTTGNDRSCRYLSEAGPPPNAAPAPTNDGTAGAPRTALELVVRRNSSDAQPKKPCDIAREYLTQVIKYWVKPALRTDNLTAPRFAIGDVNPCDSLAGIAESMGGPIEAITLGGPHKCTVRLVPGPDNTEQARKVGLVSASLAVKTDPRTVLDNPQTSKDYMFLPVVSGSGGSV
ncbi:hypothetical protein AOZ06_05150 [Kibdelosporangium phytohabitans]|uniref:Uncharacterized protein n=1 Tax=Kibdelosporangium phytohabitans TaxID=860235 RepID=A0A0N9HK15_9PSEU|nr:hypothetical protein AOZ06_05150 [Kibdelosporangium phytohabitans]